MSELLEFIHVTSGVIWAGAAITMAWFISPAARAAGPAAGPFMGAIIKRTRFSAAMAWASSLTILAGLVLWYRRFDGVLPSGDLRGFAMTIGAVSGLIAAGVGIGRQLPTVKRIEALMDQMPADGPPPPEVAARMEEVRGELMRTGNLLGWLLIVAVAGMSMA